jgi:hypothetical protein
MAVQETVYIHSQENQDRLTTLFNSVASSPEWHLSAISGELSVGQSRVGHPARTAPGRSSGIAIK